MHVPLEDYPQCGKVVRAFVNTSGYKNRKKKDVRLLMYGIHETNARASQCKQMYSNTLYRCCQVVLPVFGVLSIDAH